MPIPGDDGLDELAYLNAVGTDVLDRRGTHASRNQDQVLQARETACQRPVHEAVPVFTGGDAHAAGIDFIPFHRNAL